MKTLYLIVIGLGLMLTSHAGATDSTALNDYFCQVKHPQIFLSHLKELLPPKTGETNQELLFRYFREHHSAITNPTDVSFDEKLGLLHYRTTKDDDSRLTEFIVKLTKDS